MTFLILFCSFVRSYDSVNMIIDHILLNLLADYLLKSKDGLDFKSF